MKTFIIAFTALLAVGLTSCDVSDSSDTKAAKQTERLMGEAMAQAGVPNIKNFHERKLVKELYELRDQADLIMYAYLYNEHTGKIGDFLGRCKGYGIPAAVQYTNPERFALEPYKTTRNYNKLPQPEPNGLWTPTATSATWLYLINEKTGEAKPAYIEPLIMVFADKRH